MDKVETLGGGGVARATAAILWGWLLATRTAADNEQHSSLASSFRATLKQPTDGVRGPHIEKKNRFSSHHITKNNGGERYG